MFFSLREREHSRVYSRPMSIRIKYLIFAFVLSIAVWSGVIAGGAWVIGTFDEQFDRNPTAGVK